MCVSGTPKNVGVIWLSSLIKDLYLRDVWLVTFDTILTLTFDNVP